MTVKLTITGEKLDESKIVAIENKLRARLPHDYRAFLLSNNVAVPEQNEYVIPQVTTSVSTFFGVSDDENDDLVAEYDMFESRVPTNVLPIAAAGGGNLICLELKSGSIFFWDHEQEANEDEPVNFDNMSFLASSFTEFLEKLRPRSIQPGAHRVISVKAKPGANEKFKDYLKK
jgi:hypothetical protein